MPSFFAFQIDALSEIVDTVQGRIEVYLDGGIRTGSDVLKSLALGAKCVFIGRPAVWGLAYKVEHPSLCDQRVWKKKKKVQDYPSVFTFPVSVRGLFHKLLNTWKMASGLSGWGGSEGSPADLKRRVPSVHGFVRWAGDHCLCVQVPNKTLFPPSQAAGTWQKSTGTSYSFLNSNSPAEGSTEQRTQDSMQLLEHSSPTWIHARVCEWDSVLAEVDLYGGGVFAFGMEGWRHFSQNRNTFCDKRNRIQ